jgi:hypothetical protein
VRACLIAPARRPDKSPEAREQRQGQERAHGPVGHLVESI